MLQAITRDGLLIIPALLKKNNIQQLRRRHDYFCPSCKKRVILRAGDYVVPHFAHQRSSSCPERQGETKNHLQGKLQLFQWLTQQNIPAYLEHYLPDINQYPDIHFTFRKKPFAIEYQCAKIPSKELLQRSIGLQKMKIYPLWILGANRLRRIGSYAMKIDAFTFQAIHQFAPHLSPQLFYYSSQQHQLLLVSDIYFTHRNQALACFRFAPLTFTQFPQLFNSSQLFPDSLYRQWLAIKQDIRLSNRPVYGKEKEFRNWLYERKIHVQQLPSIIFLPNKAQHRMKVPLLHWQTKLIIEFLHPLAQGHSFSLKDAYSYLGFSCLLKSPLVHTSLRNDPVWLYLKQLSLLGVISQNYNQQWVKRRPVYFFNELENGLIGDKLVLEALFKNN